MALEEFSSAISLVEPSGVAIASTPALGRRVLYRRIGENEMNAMDVARGLSEARHEFYDSIPAHLPKTAALR